MKGDKARKIKEKEEEADGEEQSIRKTFQQLTSGQARAEESNRALETKVTNEVGSLRRGMADGDKQIDERVDNLATEFQTKLESLEVKIKDTQRENERRNEVSSLGGGASASGGNGAMAMAMAMHLLGPVAKVRNPSTPP